MVLARVWGRYSTLFQSHHLNLLVIKFSLFCGLEEEEQQTIVWSSHVQPKPRVEGLCEDGVRGIEYQFGEENLIRSFVDLGSISKGLGNWTVRSLLESDTWSRVWAC